MKDENRQRTGSLTAKNARRRTVNGGFSWPSLLLVVLLSSLGLHPSAFSSPLYIRFIDHLPPPRDETLPNLDQGQRAAAFQDAVQTAVDAHELPPATVVHDDARLPVGATLLRVYLKEWSNRRHAGFSETDVSCRFYVEVVRDGRVTGRLGPYVGRTNFDPTAMTAVEHRGVVFQQAARRAINEMSRALPRANAP